MPSFKSAQRKAATYSAIIAARNMPIRQRILQLEAIVKMLEVRNSAQEERVSRVSKHNTKLIKAVGKLQKVKGSLSNEVSTLKTKAAKYESEADALSRELIFSHPLRVVGAAVRIRYLERARQDCIKGTFVDARGTANQEMIAIGNTAAHRAYFCADLALFELGYLSVQEVSAFESLYETSLDEHKFIGHFADKRFKIWDLHGTLHCIEAHSPEWFVRKSR
ncbi:hypothetical protein N431DRAFT_460054 [Stipitochalara longipes BDJ]|nr:hypothetical protein N431DRAFT_460054 [Stipitochalara longipes BDJ]